MKNLSQFNEDDRKTMEILDTLTHKDRMHCPTSGVDEDGDDYKVLYYVPFDGWDYGVIQDAYASDDGKSYEAVAISPMRKCVRVEWWIDYPDADEVLDMCDWEKPCRINTLAGEETP